MEETETPPFLFKILSKENWEDSSMEESLLLSPEDKEFIHFSTNTQLDAIVDKYWSRVPEFLILKVETSKLKGRLVFETNPGGKNKYYHLYEGTLPKDAIVEARFISRRVAPKKVSLDVVQLGDPVLRQTARPLSKEEIASEEIQTLILTMIEVMRSSPGVGLAAPQIGRSIQLIVVEDKPEYHSYLSQEQLALRDRKPVPLQVLINPTLHLNEEEGRTEFFEGCLSIAGLCGIVSRTKAVQVEALNEKGETVHVSAKGWFARMLQHEIDHLHGILYIDRAQPRHLSTYGNLDKFWKDRPIDFVKNQLQGTH